MSGTAAIPDELARTFVRRALLPCAREARKRGAAFLRAGDPTDLRRFRVNLRKARSALWAFKKRWPEGFGKTWRRRMGRWAKLTNDLRDLDSMLESAASDRSRTKLLQRRARLFDETVARLRSERVVLQLADWERELRSAKLWVGFGESAAEELARKAARRTARPLQAMLRATRRGASPRETHQVRLAAKRLRYVLKLLAPVLGDSTDEALARLKAGHDTLGQWRDDWTRGRFVAADHERERRKIWRELKHAVNQVERLSRC